MSLNVKISTGVENVFAAIGRFFDDIVDNMDLVSAGTTSITFEHATLGALRSTATVSGENFTFDQSGAATGGTVRSVLYQVASPVTEPAYKVKFTQLDLSLVALDAALEQEWSATDPAAIEKLLFSQNWTVIGNHGADRLGRQDVSSDGVPVDLRGDDSLLMRGGDDVVFSSDGDDKLWGEGGDDRLWGENDTDRLFGGAGDDRLSGGRGNDLLYGGSGRDWLRGDRGRDILTGGQKADVFDFSGTRQGKDKITDWGGNDRLAGITFEEITVTHHGNRTLLTHDDGEVVFLGRGNLQFDQEDFIA